MHGIKNPDLGQMSKTSNQDSKKALGKVVMVVRGCSCRRSVLITSDFFFFFLFSQGHPSERPPVNPQEEEQDPTPYLGAPSAKRLKAQFRCSKCGFATGDGAQFQQHIPQHKTDENTPQCLHCGLCFTSALSLSRHLHIVHKVKEERGAEEAAAAEGRETQQDPRPIRVEQVDDLLPMQNKPEQPADRMVNSEKLSSGTDAVAPL